ncbi:MAG: thiamine pyrophosphate-binding protein [Candidatus Latescibacteria bacterium]|jgi:benzoylformate decarboxylase|nr:thiamine pyrophosphate-binding protein [Candidatus Latescibacterota bacterium]MDP7236688.1 thiamine pyrophosphate-binding protein [Candidatus Latescibacterota bacterium]
MMQELVAQLLDNKLSRRGFIKGMVAAGFASTAIDGVLNNVEAAEAPPAAGDENAYRTVTGTGGELWMEQLKASGVEYVFCNPGSTETGFYDELADTSEMQIIMGLHEGIVISMADLYYRISGKPGFVNVHAMPGTAQTAGQLYNAHKARSGMVVTAGMNDNTVFTDNVGLGPSAGYMQADVTKTFTKIAWDVRRPESIPVALRRAFKIAGTPPGGPVYLAIATYAQSGEPVTSQIIDQSKYDVPMRPRPDERKIEQVARHLIEGRQPLFITDSDLSRYGGVEKAVELVNLLGVPILDPRGSMSTHSGFPNQHPLFWDGKAFGGLDAPRSANPYEPYDVVVGLGVENIAAARGSGVPEQISRAQNAWKAAIGVDIETMGRTAPFDISVVADPKSAIEDLLDAVKSLATKERLARISAKRSDRIAPQVASIRKQIEQEVKAEFGRQPMHPYELTMSIDRAIDRDAITINENLSHDFSLRSGVIQRFGGDEKMRFGSGGGGLGWGIGAAIGAKIAEPNRQVVLNIGDGSVMYGASGFWTMARYEIPVLTIVWNNHNYQTVRHGFATFDGKMAQTGHYVGMHLGNPTIDYVGLAGSQGVEGEKADTAGELNDALTRGIAATRAGNPYVIDATIDQIGGGAGSDWYRKFSLAKTRTRDV